MGTIKTKPSVLEMKASCIFLEGCLILIVKKYFSFLQSTLTCYYQCILFCLTSCWKVAIADAKSSLDDVHKVGELCSF